MFTLSNDHKNNYYAIIKPSDWGWDEGEFFTFKASFVIVSEGSKVHCMLNS